ncbi:WhiB family transcriptional regulator (plasmid) [Streptomyces sp. NBC_00513]|nr:WhiB family transcriptional regulator [Streptomyces sp. NBC_00424]MCX5078782.1 WhiB family transcriptional regulator [Streptomyces sp. NBC_00424]WUD46297.1 WhiB family transcriptional regulator [Streptomyces sp. NBC_00513]
MAPGADPEHWTGSPAQRLKGQEECLVNCPESTRRQCLAWALDHPTHAGPGIWAGTTYTDRRRLRELRAAATK